MALSVEMVESNDSHSPAGSSSSIHEPSWEYYLRKYLMLLAGLVATATYEASFSTPGVSPPEESESGRMILRLTPRYITFVYFNATAFTASIGVILLLLVLNEKRPVWLAVLRFVMVLDLLALMGAYASGSCFDVPSTVYTWVLVVALAAYVGVHILLASYTSSESEVVLGLPEEQSPEESLKLREQRKVLMLLATFAVGISYAAGLSPPGGDSEEVHGRQHLHRMTFFYCNTTAFVASLLIIVLLLVRRLQSRCCAMVQLCALILVVLLGLLGAYVAGSCGNAGSSAYVIALIDLVLVYIFLVMMVLVVVSNPLKNTNWLPHQFVCAYSSCSSWLQKRGFGEGPLQADRPTSDGSRQGQGSNMVMVMDEANAGNDKPAGMEKVKSLLLLLATLVATITYHAGLDPPGGVWSRDGQRQQNRYKAGDPILSVMNPSRYMVFFYCNSTAFVASLVVILMVRARGLIRRHTLEVAMLLCLLGLIGAYAAGSCRDMFTTVKLLALPAATLVYVVIHVVFFTLDHKEMSYEDNRKLEKRRKRLLLLAILVATITYQAGLTPQGGFWTEGHRAGDPIMADTYGMRYQAFFYCNSTSFMVSITLIILLVNPNLYKPGIRCYALYVCMVIALFGLMGAYLSGTIPDPQTSMYVFVLVAVEITLIAITAMALLVLLIFGEANGEDDSNSSRPGPAGDRAMRRQHKSGNSARRKYMMVLAILAASVTYQAAIKPPGGDQAGNAVMRLNNPARYSAFFYCNSTSFVASVVVIVLLLQESLQNNILLLYAMNTAIVLDLLGLLGAYAVGSSRDWKATGYVIALFAAVLAYIAIHLVLWFLGRRAWEPEAQTKSSTNC
ncbi:hypothetical protein TRIUR3_28774 [Triticum urartu]|uniref:PGG domain-containing protein n=2 Tax=Triticum urartu TaxID=4572 RepID=M8ACY7_TRIUA|nr:hypothetical protein TRIUR3_28774 [Triticum urartu]